MSLEILAKLIMMPSMDFSNLLWLGLSIRLGPTDERVKNVNDFLVSDTPLSNIHLTGTLLFNIHLIIRYLFSQPKG